MSRRPEVIGPSSLPFSRGYIQMIGGSHQSRGIPLCGNESEGVDWPLTFVVQAMRIEDSDRIQAGIGHVETVTVR